jgi:hypothetical protein
MNVELLQNYYTSELSVKADRSELFNVSVPSGRHLIVPEHSEWVFPSLKNTKISDISCKVAGRVGQVRSRRPGFRFFRFTTCGTPLLHA